MIYCFIGVNYGTSEVIKKWLDSIEKCYNGKKEVIIIDNFKNEQERKKIINLSKELNFHLILSDNIGYGKALNKGIKYAKKNFKGNIIIFAGNLDLIYKNIPKLEKGNFVYVPKVMEGLRNRNPFLTKLQKKIIPIYRIAGLTQSSLVYYGVILINKIVGFFPSEIWAVHGSLFCFNGSLIEDNDDIFNDKSFLYGEELEFASYMESKNAKFIDTNIVVEHKRNIATKHVNKSKKDFLKLWWPSFKNWWERWK